MRNCDAGTTGQQSVQRACGTKFSLRIDGTRGFVEDEKVRIGQR